MGELIVPSVHRAGHRKGIIRYQATGEATVLNRRIEITGLHKQGHEFPVELSITKASGGDREVFVGFLRDISERKEQEQALCAAKASADALAAEREATLSQLAEAVIVTDADGQIVFVNEAAARLHGLARLQVGPEDYSTAYSLLTEDGRPYPPADLPLARAVRGETVSDARWRIRRPDGREVLAVGSARPIYGPGRKQTGAVLTAHDETDRIRAEVALRELNESLEEHVAALAAERQRIWDISADLFVIVGFDGFYRAANPAWLNLLGYDPQELIGTRFDALVHPEDVEVAQSAFGRLVGGEVLKSIDVRVRASDGSFRSLSWTCVPVEDAFYASGRDVTEQRSLEEQLRQSQKMEALGQLTGGIAHDFNNLLTIISAAVELMRRRDLPDDKRARYVDAISETVERGAKLTRQLLAFARRHPLKPEVFDVISQVHAVVDLVRPILGPRIRIAVNVPDRPSFVDADLGQFETALLNLAVNARDAMNQEGALTITVHHADEIPSMRGQLARSGKFIAISVSDVGTGIATEHLDKLFEPFFTTKEVGRGTGLGLSQVFGFAHQTGGDIAVKSSPGEGSTFTLYLPQADRSADPKPGRSAGAPDQLRPHDACVLIVEDDEAVGKFSTETLQDLGYRTRWVSNAADALAELSKNDLRFDLVFSDIIMPGMDGLELARTIRERHPGLPVVLTSGYSDVLAREGTHGFPLLHKPYSVEALARILREPVQTSLSDSAG